MKIEIFERRTNFDNLDLNFNWSPAFTRFRCVAFQAIEEASGGALLYDVTVNNVRALLNVVVDDDAGGGMTV